MERLEKLLKCFSITTFITFGGVGAFITISSMLSSFFWLKIVGTPLFITYFLNYSIFILLSYSLNRRITFNVEFSLKSLFSYYLVYVVGMLLGMVLLYLFKKLVKLENWVYAFIVIPFTMTANYIMATLVFKGGSKL